MLLFPMMNKRILLAYSNSVEVGISVFKSCFFLSLLTYCIFLFPIMKTVAETNTTSNTRRTLNPVKVALQKKKMTSESSQFFPAPKQIRTHVSTTNTSASVIPPLDMADKIHTKRPHRSCFFGYIFHVFSKG